MNYSGVLPTGMFGHIFRKDWRLLRLLVIANALLQGMLAVVSFHSQPYPMTDGLSALGAMVTLALLVTMCLLIVLTVQQEVLPGVNQDWLVRPIKRRDLLLAKLSSIALFVHGPIFAANLLAGLAEGYPFTPMLLATLSGNLQIALIFTLPVMTVAALTRSIGEALIGSLCVFLGLILARLLILGVLFPYTHTFHFFGPVSGTGIEWIWRAMSHLVLLLTIVAALWLQYFRRCTLESRVVFTVGLLLFMLVQGLPWAPAFAVQRVLSLNPQAGESLSIAFDPGSRQSVATPGGGDFQLSQDESDDEKSDGKKSRTITRLMLPMRISGLPVGRILHVDRCTIRLVSDNGRTVYRGTGRIIDVPALPLGGEQATVSQPIQISTALYEKVAHRPLRIELEYSLTLLRSRTLPPLAALNDERRIPDVGRCATRINTTGSAVEVGCRNVGMLPSCVSLALELGDRRNPQKSVCHLSYEPAALRFGVDPVDHIYAKLPFRDPTGVAHYPVDESGLRDARVILTVHEPEAHLSRHITLRQVQLSDWRAPDAR